jgi:low affinity Fe/Cu permease
MTEDIHARIDEVVRRNVEIKAAVVAMIYHESRERDEAVADPPSAEEESTAEE